MNDLIKIKVSPDVNPSRSITNILARSLRNRRPSAHGQSSFIQFHPHFNYCGDHLRRETLIPFRDFIPTESTSKSRALTTPRATTNPFKRIRSQICLSPLLTRQPLNFRRPYPHLKSASSHPSTPIGLRLLLLPVHWSVQGNRTFSLVRGGVLIVKGQRMAHLRHMRRDSRAMPRPGCMEIKAS